MMTRVMVWLVRASMRFNLRRAGLRRKKLDGIVYWAGGRGSETLVLVHGVNDQAGSWFAVVAKLAANYKLIVPDLAGHGESEPRTGALSLDLILDKLDAVLAAEHADKVTLAGNSMGGWVSMLYAVRHPERVARLVLEDASGMAWPLPNVPLVPKTREDAILAIKAVRGPNAPTPSIAINALLGMKDAPMARMIATGGFVEHLVDAHLPSLKVPTTIIWGKDDGLLPVAYAETLQKRIAGSKLHVIDGAAHIPHQQQPEKFLACLTANS